MPVLTDEEKAALRVENFIFHAVHHGHTEPTLHNEVPIGGFERFFIDRVIDTLKGNRYVFDPGSTTLQALKSVEANPGSFVETSKELARQFHRARDRERPDRRFKRGILLVTGLRAGNRHFHSLIKYDHGEQVIDIIERGVGADLEQVMNPLTENKKALQKSALIELDDDGGKLVVIDHSERSGITDFFRDFLGVRRAFSEDEMTKAVEKSVRKTILMHNASLPATITSQWRQLLVDVATRRLDFNPDQYFSDLFGAHETPAMRDTWQAQLAANGIEGEAFSFNLESLADTGLKRYQTAENINIIVPAGAHDRLKWDNLDDGSVIITIRTSSLTER